MSWAIATGAWLATAGFFLVLARRPLLGDDKKVIPITTVKQLRRFLWPEWYGRAQFAVMALTLTQISWRSVGPPMPGNFGDLVRSIRLFGVLTDPIKFLANATLAAVTWFLGKTQQQQQHKRSIGTNIGLYLVVLALDCAISHTLDCPHTDRWFSGMPLRTQLTDLMAKWRLFHAPDFIIVRISHALTYLPVLMCLTRSNGTDWARWRIFMLFIPDLIADLAHYASDPAIAAIRLDYDAEDLCTGMDRHFLRTFISFPMNWLFLTTGAGRVA